MCAPHPRDALLCLRSRPPSLFPVRSGERGRGAQKMVQHAVRLSQGLPGTERVPEAETAGSEGGWLSKLTGFLRKT
jgi:hypothetical protein